MSKVIFSKLHDRATIPSQQTRGSAGFDLVCTGSVSIAPTRRMLVNTGITAKIPSGYVGIIKPRSGLAHRYGIDVLAGVIDSDYRGEIKVILINHGKGHFLSEAHKRIAQLVIIPCLTQVNDSSGFDAVERGDSGFGSTGVDL